MMSTVRGAAVMMNRAETSRVVRHARSRALPTETNSSFANPPQRGRSRLQPGEEVVHALTLSDVWPLPLGASPEILVIDAEGAESELLGSGDLPNPPPNLVLFEHVHLSEDAQVAIHRNLARQGFRRLADLKHLDHSSKELQLPAQDRLYGRARQPELATFVG